MSLVLGLVSGAAAGAPLTPGNVLVSENDVLREYTPAGATVQTFPIPYPGGRPGTESARDVFVDASGLVHVYNGTFFPYMSTLDPTSGTWVHNTFLNLDAGGNVSYGGITSFLGFVYTTDVTAAGDALEAIELPPDIEPDVAYGAAVVVGAENPDGAQDFIDGLLDGDGAEALERAGFLPPP